MKKIIALALCVLILLSISPLVFAAGPLKYVALGDSISWGSGVYNSREAVFGKIVADTNGYDYTNCAIPGHTSEMMLDRLENPDVTQAVKNADIITISIGGNDFLQQNIPLLVAQAAVGDYHHLDNIEHALYENLDRAISFIRELNPGVTVLVHTLYNTHAGLLGKIYDLAIPRVNRVVTGYLADHPGAYEILDVAALFEGHPEYVAVDTIHPTAVGNVAIAGLLLEKLYEMGLGENTQPVVGSIGIDEIPFSSYIFRRIMDIFRKIFAMFSF